MTVKNDNRRVSIVIPVFNNEHTLRILFKRLMSSIEIFQNMEFELIFINDGSTDASKRVLENLIEQALPNTTLTVIDLEGNFGQLAALFAGYRNVTGEAVITLSADLQDPPELLKQFIQKWVDGIDLVIGLRAERSDSRIWRVTSKVAYWFISTKHTNIPKGGYDYYLMTREILDYILGMKGRFRFLPTDLARLKPRVYYLNYHRPARAQGKSGYSLLDRWQIFLTAVIDTSYRWIQLFSLLGLCFSLCGIFLMSTVIYGYFSNSSPFQGFTLIVCLILISSGLQLLTLSFIGEYVWRSYDIARNKPLYLIRSVEHFSSKQNDLS